MTDLPRSGDEISEPWLLSRLNDGGLGIDTLSLTVGPLEHAIGFQGNFSHLHIRYPDGRRGPETMVVKMVPENEQLRAIGRQLAIYSREAAFYLEIGADAGLPVAACYGAQIDEETGDSTILLEDLTHLRTGNQYAGFTQVEAERAIEQYARMHARWWNDAKLAAFGWLPPWDLPDMVAYIPAAYPPAWQACASLFDGRLSAEDAALAGLLGEHIGDLMIHAGTGPTTLVHGDARHDNLMFSGDNEAPPHFVDWQYAASGRGMLDIAYYLTQGGSPDLVAPIEEDLVRQYHAHLLSAGVGDYGWDECWADYRRFSLYMMVFPIFTAAMIDPSSAEQRDGLHIILRRGFDAAQRLGSADLLSG